MRRNCYGTSPFRITAASVVNGWTLTLCSEKKSWRPGVAPAEFMPFFPAG